MFTNEILGDNANKILSLLTLFLFRYRKGKDSVHI